MPAIFETTTTWVAISFVIFWTLAFKPLKAAITKWLDGKITTISRDLTAAAHLRYEAEELLREARARHATAATESQTLIAHAQAEAKALTERAGAELTASLARRERAAEARIAQLEHQAEAALKSQVARAAIATAQALLQSGLTDADRDTLADSAISDITALSKNRAA